MPVRTITSVTCKWSNADVEAMPLVNNGFQVNKITYWDIMGGAHLEPVQRHYKLSRLTEKDKREILELLIEEWNKYSLIKIKIENSYLWVV